jgi:hypothetical protein
MFDTTVYQTDPDTFNPPNEGSCRVAPPLGVLRALGAAGSTAERAVYSCSRPRPERTRSTAYACGGTSRSPPASSSPSSPPRPRQRSDGSCNRRKHLPPQVVFWQRHLIVAPKHAPQSLSERVFYNVTTESAVDALTPRGARQAGHHPAPAGPAAFRPR